MQENVASHIRQMHYSVNSLLTFITVSFSWVCKRNGDKNAAYWLVFVWTL